MENSLFLLDLWTQLYFCECINGQIRVKKQYEVRKRSFETLMCVVFIISSFSLLDRVFPFQEYGINAIGLTIVVTTFWTMHWRHVCHSIHTHYPNNVHISLNISLSNDSSLSILLKAFNSSNFSFSKFLFSAETFAITIFFHPKWTVHSVIVCRRIY